MNLEADDPRHGTVNGYSNLKCRCVPCRGAWTAFCKEARLRRAGRLAPEDDRHGRRSTYYNWVCRCDRCTDAAFPTAKASRAERLARREGRVLLAVERVEKLEQKLDEARAQLMLAMAMAESS